MKSKVITFILVLFNIISFSQEKVDISISYKLTYKIDSTSEKVNKENFILFVNKQKSMYQSIAKYFKDSLSKQPNQDQAAIAIKYGTENDYYIIYNSKDKVLNHFQPNLGANIYYSTNYKIQWKIEQETKEILNLKCRKATTKMFGRKWIAWFAEEYPLPFGPYKFNGLPGLILELYDSKNYYNFNAYYIKKEKNTLINFNIQNDYAKTTKEKFWELVFKNKFDVDYKYRDFTFQDPNVIQTMRKRMIEKQKIYNNPIELIH